MLCRRLLGTDTGAIAAMAQGDPTARVVPVADIPAMESAARELLKMKVDRQPSTNAAMP